MPTIAPPSPPYLGPAKFHGSATNKPIKRIVLHGTVSPTVKGGARATAKYFRETVTRPSSAHYCADPFESVQVVFDSVVAFHAPPNEHSIGYELCDWVATNNGRGPGPAPLSRWDDAAHTAMLHIAAQDVARLCLAYDVPIRFLSPAQLRLGMRGICEHSDVSAAFHQTSHWDLGNFPRTRFLAMVKAEAKKLTTPPKPPPPPPGLKRARANVVMSASRFDRTPASLLAAVRTYLPGNDIILLTEVANDKRLAVVRFLPGVGVVNTEPGNRSECAILYKQWKWKPLVQRAYRLTDRQSSEHGTILPFAAGAIFAHSRTGQTLGILLGHLPAHLEGKGGFRTDPQGVANTLAWKESVDAEAAIAKRWRANPQVDHVMVFNDWNVSRRLKWVRDYLDARFPGMTCNWDGHLPVTGGTHDGDRVIDFGYGDVDWVSSALLTDDASSDHRPSRAVALLRKILHKVTRTVGG
jgi:hypothetical protein